MAKVSLTITYTVVFICLGAIFASAQEATIVTDKPMDYKALRMKLVFRSPIRESDVEISKQVAAEVRKRSVNFIIDSEQEAALKKIGATDELLLVVKNSVPAETRKETARIDKASRLYQKFTDNYSKKTVQELEIAIEAGKEFIHRYGKDLDFREQADFVEAQLNRLEKLLAPCLRNGKRTGHCVF